MQRSEPDHAFTLSDPYNHQWRGTKHAKQDSVNRFNRPAVHLGVGRRQGAKRLARVRPRSGRAALLAADSNWPPQRRPVDRGVEIRDEAVFFGRESPAVKYYAAHGEQHSLLCYSVSKPGGSRGRHGQADLDLRSPARRPYLAGYRLLAGQSRRAADNFLRYRGRLSGRSERPNRQACAGLCNRRRTRLKARGEGRRSGKCSLWVERRPSRI